MISIFTQKIVTNKKISFKLKYKYTNDKIIKDLTFFCDKLFKFYVFKEKINDKPIAFYEEILFHDTLHWEDEFYQAEDRNIDIQNQPTRSNKNHIQFESKFNYEPRVLEESAVIKLIFSPNNNAKLNYTQSCFRI